MQCLHTPSPGSFVAEQIDDRHRQRSSRVHHGHLLIRDAEIRAMHHSARASRKRVQHRHHMAEVAHVGATAAVSDGFDVLGSNKHFRIGAEQPHQLVILTQREVAGDSC